jgi:hypothetical protein
MSTHNQKTLTQQNLDLPDTFSSKEIEFIVCLSRLPLTVDRLERARELANGELDWSYTYEAACYHGVFIAFFTNVKKHFWTVVPPQLAKALTVQKNHLTHQTLSLVGTFLAFHAELEKQNIESAVFKGPTLAATAYGDLLMREFSDIDVLVAKKDVSKVQQILLDTGYSLLPVIEPPLEGDFLRSKPYLDLTCEQTFSKSSPVGLIDLHWEIQPTHLFPIETQEVFENLVSVNIENRQIKTIEPNLLFVVLAVHATKHRWERLVWICDSAELLKTPEQFDWQKVFSIASRLHVTDSVAIALLLANRVFGSTIPPLPSTVQTAKLNELYPQIIANLSLLDMDGPGSNMRAWLFCTSLQNGFFDKMRYLAAEFLKPNIADFMRLRLPRPLFFIYYILHPAWIFYDAISKRVTSS